jgi:hypothetical protein
VKHLRTPALILVLLYSSLVVGMNFHSHGKEQQVSVHCKICEFSQTFASQPLHFHAAVEISRVGMVLAPACSVLQQNSIRSIPGRSPPPTA